MQKFAPILMGYICKYHQTIPFWILTILLYKITSCRGSWKFSLAKEICMLEVNTYVFTQCQYLTLKIEVARKMFLD